MPFEVVRERLRGDRSHRRGMSSRCGHRRRGTSSRQLGRMPSDGVTPSGLLPEPGRRWGAGTDRGEAHSMSYAPLWSKSHFSFLEGASHPDELVEQAHAFGLPALALTDRDGVHGAVRAHVRARALGLSLVLGAEMTVGAEDRAGATGDAPPEPATDTPPVSSTCVLLATDRTGYANLCRLITTGRLRRPKGASCVTWREVCARAAGLIALWGGDRSLLVRDDAPRAVIAAMREAFGDRLYAMVSRQLFECAQRQSVRRAEFAAGLARPVESLDQLTPLRGGAPRPTSRTICPLHDSARLRVVGSGE